MPLLTWINDSKFLNNPEIHSRNLFAQKNYSLDPSSIVKKYIGLSLNETREFLSYSLGELGIVLSGVGIELGAGVGGISNSLLSLYPAIQQIYAIEIVPDVVNILQRKVANHENNEARLISVLGSFDDIKLPDNSVDFIIEFDSLHHSENLGKTLKESARVLKRGGILIAFDRVHFDWLTDAQREFMLNIEYGDQFKVEYGIPLSTKLTRRQNGEHEIRASEWQSSFRYAKLSPPKRVIFHKKCWRGLIFGIISQIPFSLRSKYKFYPQLSRVPATFFSFYLLPFLPMTWKKLYHPMDVSFFRKDFLSKTAFISHKI